MSEDALSRAQHLSDGELVARVKLLVRHEREATVALLAHLAVLDERRLYLGEGCASMFTYCTQILHLAEHAAYNRIEAARAARRFPVILELLASGSVTLTAVRRLAPHLTPVNHADLLAASRHRTTREIEEFIAQLHPQPSVPSSVRALPAPKHEPSTATMPGPTQDAASAQAPGDTMDLSVPPSFHGSPARPAVVAPLGLRRYRVQFTATTETYDKLRLAQDLLRHQVPDGDLGEIMDRALTLLIDALARQKFAATDRPQSRSANQDEVPGSASRNIPAAVKRPVWLRDGGRCAFIAPTGYRCTERGFLEFHHVIPYGAGGQATVNNIELRCRAHNGYEAALLFNGPRAPVAPQIAHRATAREKQPPASSARDEPG